MAPLRLARELSDEGSIEVMDGSSASHVELCPDWLLCLDELLVALCVVLVIMQGKPEVTRSFLRIVPSKREEKVMG